MAFKFPSLKELGNRAANEFKAHMDHGNPFLQPNNMYVTAKVIAGAVSSPVRWLQYIEKQMFVHSCSGYYLDRHGNDLEMPRKQASFAEGTIVLSGEQSGSVPSGTIVTRGDGAEYKTISSVFISSGLEVAVNVISVDRGSIFNAQPNTPMQLNGIESFQAIVGSEGIGGGADLEGHEQYRARLLYRKRNPPRGGKDSDYIIWASKVPGVTRVYVDPVTRENERDSVGVCFLMDNLYENGIAQPADVQTVSDYLDTERPAGAVLDVFTPSPFVINVRIAGLGPDNADVREAVDLELRRLFNGLPVATTVAPFTLYKSKISEAISIASGEEHHDLSEPSNNINIPYGSVPVLGEILFEE